jgi:monodechloroaminopyrrolnitrin synthase
MLTVSYSQESRPDGFTLQLQSQAEMLRREAAINQKIADADPLGADGTFQQFPDLNERHDIEGISQALEQAVAKAQSLREWNFIYANAAIRDLSMLGASLIRFNREPADCVPGFSELLQTLAVDVAAKIPRDSFIDYTSRNPPNERERTFTSLPQEKIFIDSLRRGMSSLEACLTNLLTACTFPFAQREFGEAMREATASFQVMIDAIVQVKRGVTPEVFTHYIRPFFEPFRVGDKPFSAPSGAEMPILNIDQIIWGAGCVDELYITYFNANIIRLPAIYQEISQTFAEQKSLMTMLKERLATAMPLGNEERRSIQELHHLLTRIYTFRMPHYKIAEENTILRQRENGGTQEVKGSGGFGLLETKYVLDQTIQCRQLTAQALSQHVSVNN